MDIINHIAENYGSYLGVAVAFIMFFEKVARITPTQTDDKILAVIHKVASVLGVNVRDNPGK